MEAGSTVVARVEKLYSDAMRGALELYSKMCGCRGVFVVAIILASAYDVLSTSSCHNVSGRGSSGMRRGSTVCVRETSRFNGSGARHEVAEVSSTRIASYALVSSVRAPGTVNERKGAHNEPAHARNIGVTNM